MRTNSSVQILCRLVRWTGTGCFPGQLATLFLFDHTPLLFGNADFRQVSSDPQAGVGPTHGPLDGHT